MKDNPLYDTLISALTEAKKQESTEVVEAMINPESDVSDIHGKVSMSAINIAAAIHRDWSEKEKQRLMNEKS